MAWNGMRVLDGNLHVSVPVVVPGDRGCLAVLLVLALLTTGCPQMLIAKGAATVAGIVADDRSLEQQGADEGLKAKIEEGLLDESEALAGRVNVDVFNGRVLLTGVVGDEESRRTAWRIARESSGGGEVYDDIEVGAAGGLPDAAEDAAINKALGVNMLADEGIASQSLLHRVVNGEAFVIGEVRSDDQIDTVRSVARQTPGVDRVVTHITVEPH